MTSSLPPAAEPAADKPTRLPWLARVRPLLSRLDWHVLSVLAGVGLFTFAAIVLFQVVETLSWPSLKEAMGQTPVHLLAVSAGFTAISYLALCGYDLLALRHLKVTTVSTRLAAFTSFIGHAFTYTLGFGVLSGGAVRLRLYGGAGVEGPRVVAVGVLCTLVFWLGLLTLGGLALMAAPDLAGSVDQLPTVANSWLGAAMVAGVAGFLTWSSLAARDIGSGEWRFSIPGWRVGLGAIAIGALDTAAAAAALYVLIPEVIPGGYPAFLAVFVLATALGVVSHVPGGLGVFEAVLLAALPTEPSAGLIGALLLYRLVYYIGPFVLAVVLLGSDEVLTRRRAIGSTVAGVARVVRPLAPQVAAVTVFLGGVVLLLSGALPAEAPRLASLRHIVPLPFVEASHLLGSVIGFVLLVLSSGLLRRLATAWRASVALLLAGATFSLTKGFDYEEALICLAIVGLLVAARGEFYRRSDLFETAPSIDWIAAAIVAIGASIWVGLFAYRHVEYASDLWWAFAYHGDAPRFLRATFAVAVVAIGVSVYMLVHRPPQRGAPDDAETLAIIAPIVEASLRTEAQLAWLGDKRFLVDEARTGFVMYGVNGRSFVAMGDPVTREPAALPSLVWRFAELADREHAAAVFYQVTTTHLPAYLDAGFSLVKLGEEALVDLSIFTLEGSTGRKLRQTRSRCERDGLSFSIVPAADIDSVMAELRDVSDRWLGEKGSEKGFSLGFWSESYLRRYDTAIVRREGKAVAFANIWRSAGKAEFSVDLMRHAPEAPSGTMDMLFIELMQMAKTEGYAWFNLGMTPLAGQPEHRLASTWARFAGFIYRRGDRFYNFEGLRAFKEKFKPDWRPRYLAYRGGLALPQVLLDVTLLVANSPKRAIDTQNSPEAEKALPVASPASQRDPSMANESI